MVYVVERHLPDLHAGERLSGLRCLRQPGQQPADHTEPVRYLGSPAVIDNDARYCQFDALSPVDVFDTNHCAGLPVDRIVPAVTVTPKPGEPQ
jgi:hypothetical protein